MCLVPVVITNVYIDSFSAWNERALPVHFMGTAASRKCTKKYQDEENGLSKLFCMVIVIFRNETVIIILISFLVFF